MPRMINSRPQTARPTPMMPGKMPGPTCCPGMRGKPCTWMTRAPPSSASRAPQTASFSFTAELLGDADRLHRRAEVGVGLGHERRELVRSGVDHAEAARAHEVGVVLALGDLRD